MTASATPVWGDPTAWGNPPRLTGEVTADVCVVGLGGSGLAAIRSEPTRRASGPTSANSRSSSASDSA